MTVMGDYGYLSIREGKLLKYYIVNGKLKYGDVNIETGPVLKIKIKEIQSENRLKVKMSDSLKETEGKNLSPFVRVNFANNLNYGYTLDHFNSIEGTLKIKDNWGFKIPEPGRLVLSYYPREEIIGDNFVYLFPLMVQ